MITPLEELPLGFEEDIAFIRIASLYKTYYNVIPNVRFFEQKNGQRVTAVISKADGVINLCASTAADFEELRAFVFSLSGRLFCSDETLRLLDTGLNYWCGDIMRLESKIDTQQDVTYTPDIKTLYFGMKQEFELPAFEDFYTDIFYRRRADNLHLCAVQEDTFVISSAMTVAESDDAAIIGGVFTRDEHRRKGYAKRTVKGLCSVLDKKNIYLLIRDPSLCGFYEGIGFRKTGIWTETEI